MKKIPLTQGKFALVDDEDFERISKFTWQSIERGGRFHAKRTTSRRDGRKSICMHREILLIDDPLVDTHHRDENGLNNTRNNLIGCSRQNNAQGFRIKRPETTSCFRGVAWDSQTNKWRAKVCPNGKTIHLGRFSSPQEAAQAYDAAARELFGDFAHTNFPI